MISDKPTVEYIREYYGGVLKSIGISALISIMAMILAYVLQLCFRAPIPLGAAAALVFMGVIWLLLTLFQLYKNVTYRRNALVDYKSDPTAFYIREQMIMNDEISGLNKERTFHLLLFIVGFFMAVFGVFGPIGPFSCGAGAAISFMAGLMLSFCLFDGYRASFYRDKLSRLARREEEE